MASNFDISFDEEELSSTQEEIFRCNSLENEKLKNEVISMYQEVEQFLKSDGYSEDLLLELRELYQDFLNVLRERRKDMEEYDHGIVIAGLLFNVPDMLFISVRWRNRLWEILIDKLFTG